MGQVDRSADDLRDAAFAAVGARGSPELSLSRLAFFEEFCPAGGSPEGGMAGDGAEFFRRLYSPCTEFQALDLELNPGVDACVIVVEGDALLPEPSDRYLEEAAEVKVVKGEHGQLDLIGVCDEGH